MYTYHGVVQSVECRVALGYEGDTRCILALEDRPFPVSRINGQGGGRGPLTVRKQRRVLEGAFTYCSRGPNYVPVSMATLVDIIPPPLLYTYCSTYLEHDTLENTVPREIPVRTALYTYAYRHHNVGYCCI